MNSYEQKRQERIDRLRDRAIAAKREADATFDRAHKMADVIPFGQPILVGHHSERRDRNYRGKIQKTFERASEAQDKAAYYASRAAAAESNTAISSDDPEAVVKLREKLTGLEKMQDTMKAANKIVKRKSGMQDEKVKELEALGLKDPARLFTPDFCGRLGFADYQITNNGAEIRRCKQRIKQLLEATKREHKEYSVGDIRVIENTDENRVQIFFPKKPTEAVRDMLKARGFHWSSYNGAWQRQLNNAGIYAAQEVLKKITEQDNDVHTT